MYLPRTLRPLAALVVTLALALAGTTPAGAETGPMSAESDGARLDALGLDADLVAAVKLRCHGHVGDDGPVVGCTWKRHRTDADVRVWQLWNLQVSPETGVRNLVAEVGTDTTSVRDTEVEAPAKYLYAVVGLNGAGEVVARSRVDAVRLGERPHRDIERLRLECTGVAADDGPVIGCDWSAVEDAPAVEYRLFRTSKHRDSGLVATTGLDVTSYRDADVHAGVRYRYWVVGVDEHGRLVAASRSAWAGVELPERDREHDRVRDADSVRDVAKAEEASDVDELRVAEREPVRVPEIDRHPDRADEQRSDRRRGR